MLQTREFVFVALPGSLHFCTMQRINSSKQNPVFMNRYNKVLISKQLLAFFLLLLNVSWMTAQTVTVSGRIIPNPGTTSIVVSGEAPGQPPFSLFSFTDANGNYSVSMTLGSSFTITPAYDADPLNGVTTYDEVLIALHYLGIEALNSPYKIIAADVNNSGTIDTLDVIEIRKVIVNFDSTFTNNTSWRFVRADYVFPDPLNPFVPPFPEVATFNNLTTDVQHVDFIAVKIGDVNQSVIGGSNNGSVPYLGMTGRVRFDQNNNCIGESSEPNLQDWLVTARGSAGTYYATTNISGLYHLYFPTGSSGNYDVFLSPPNALWSVCNDTIFNVAISNDTVVTQDFSAQVVAECPALEVDLSAPYLRRCFESNYTIFYCNKGTIAAENATVEVTFDPFLEVQGSTLPWTTVDGQTYTFPVGTVAAGDCGSFQVPVKVSCEATPGQTHCSTAHIFPDTLCAGIDSLWSGADLLVSGECDGENIVFTVTNTGADMTEPVGYVVIEDIMIQMVGGSIQLGHGESQTITLPANGSTWRLQVDQVLHHPSNQLVSAAVEGCGANGQGSASLGIIPQFPTNNAGLFEDEDCQVNISSFDPNDKQGFPRGVGAAHYIPQGQEIEYMIRFQNTGTDTAFHIIVLDTLPNSLDLTTLRVGGGSHPYDYQVLGEGVVQFVFDNIMLPDSNVNEAASHGYLRFTIAPKTGLPDGTVVKNQAAIFFDFNTPVITNQTWHTLGSAFLGVNVIFQPGLELDVFPNPTSTTATFSLKTPLSTAGTLRLFDARGRLVRTMNFDHNIFELPMGDLPPGFYAFRLNAANGTALAAGKIVRTY